jgi:putative peptidoglycan lipid II flippase
MSIAVFFSRILGLVRDQVMAAFFGTTFVNDAFNIAFNIPNLLRRLFGEGALSAAFVPIYNELGLKRGQKYQFLFAINVLSILSFFLLVLTILGVIFAPILVRLLYPGLESQTAELAIKLCHIMFPYLFFIGLSSTFIAILNSHNKFFITGLSSGLLNIGWISMVLFGSLILKNSGLAMYDDASTSPDLIFYAAYGVMLGGFLQTIINLPFLKSLGYELKIILRLKGEAMRSLWYRFLPAMLGMGVREINLIADALIASFLPVGSISALGFGNRLMQLPLGIFGISVGTAVLPQYSRYFTEKRWSDISETVKFSIHYIIYILAPISIIMIMGSEVFIRLIFQRGSFGETAVTMTQLALIFYTIGLTFYGLNQVVTPLFYATKDTKTPLKIATFMVGLNIALSITLMQFMQHAGIALSTSLTALTQFCIMMLVLRKKLPQIVWVDYLKNLLKMLVIIVALIAVLFAFDRLYPHGETFWGYLIQAVAFLSVALVTLLCLFQILKPDYYIEISSSVWQKVARRKKSVS